MSDLLVLEELESPVWVMEMYPTTRHVWGNKESMRVMGKADLGEFVGVDLMGDMSTGMREMVKCWQETLEGPRQMIRARKPMYPNNTHAVVYDLQIAPIDLLLEGRVRTLGLLFGTKVEDEHEAGEVQLQLTYCSELLRQSANISVLYNMEGQVLFANPLAQKHFKGEHTLLGKGDWTMDAIFDGGALGTEHPQYKELLEAVSAGKTFTHEALRGGRYYLTTARRTRDPKTGRYGVLVDESDITRLKEHENELRIANETQSKFFAAVSHELRTPLNGIIGLSGSLIKSTKHDLTQEVRKTLEVIYSSGARLANLVNDVVDAASLRERALVVKALPFDLSLVVEDVLALLRPLLRRSVVLRSCIARGQAIVLGDADRVAQILHNLVGNAAKFTHKGAITVGVEESSFGDGGAGYVVSVRDEGVGIPEDKLQDIFQAFRQVDTKTTKRYGGTGLGLNLVMELVHAHGGKIYVSSKLKQGSTFSFSLPMADEETTLNPSSAPPPAQLPMADEETVLSHREFEAGAAEGFTEGGSGRDRAGGSLVRVGVRQAGRSARLSADEGSDIGTSPGSPRKPESLRSGGSSAGLKRVSVESVHDLRARADLEERVRELEEQVASRDADCSELKQQLAQRGREIARLEKELAAATAAANDNEDDAAAAPPESDGGWGLNPHRAGFGGAGEGQGGARFFVSAEQLRQGGARGEVSRKGFSAEDVSPRVGAGRKGGLRRGFPGSEDLRRRVSTGGVKGGGVKNMQRRESFDTRLEILATEDAKASAGWMPSHSDLFGGVVEVLSVDDSLTNQMVIEGILREADFKVEVAMSGAEALTLLSERSYLPDLILLDMRMPGMSGHEVVARIREKHPTTTLPIIMVSAEGAEGSIVAALTEGCNDYVTKPVSSGELLARVDTQLRLKTLWMVEMLRARSTGLLERMLPPDILSRLLDGEEVVADRHDAVSVIFADIVGFTELSQRVDSAEIVSMLNRIFNEIDEVVGETGLWKIDTIGDAYLAVAGRDGGSSTDHAGAAVDFGTRILGVVTQFPYMSDGSRLRLRVGIHSGPAIAGLVGSRNVKYSFFGDTVNTASRMESTGFPMCIQVSDATHALLAQSGRGKEFVGLGERQIKGKGAMRTYLHKSGAWQEAVAGYGNPPPAAPSASVPAIAPDLASPRPGRPSRPWSSMEYGTWQPGVAPPREGGRTSPPHAGSPFVRAAEEAGITMSSREYAGPSRPSASSEYAWPSRPSASAESPLEGVYGGAGGKGAVWTLAGPLARHLDPEVVRARMQRDSAEARERHRTEDLTRAQEALEAARAAVAREAARAERLDAARAAATAAKDEMTVDLEEAKVFHLVEMAAAKGELEVAEGRAARLAERLENAEEELRRSHAARVLAEGERAGLKALVASLRQGEGAAWGALERPRRPSHAGRVFTGGSPASSPGTSQDDLQLAAGAPARPMDSMRRAASMRERRSSGATTAVSPSVSDAMMPFDVFEPLGSRRPPGTAEWL